MNVHLAGSDPADLDPALVALVKCHVSTFLRWDLLRQLAQNPGSAFDGATLARMAGRPGVDVEATLLDLADEGLIRVRRSRARLARYSMEDDEPTTRVMQRLVAAAQRSEDVRRFIIARVVTAGRGDSQTLTA